MNQLFKKFQQDIFALIFLGGGLFVGLALISYNPVDPSFNSIGAGLRATNYCGIVGSFLSDALYQLFGVAIWIGIGGMFSLAYQSFQGKKLSFKDIRYVWGSLAILNIASLVSVYLPDTKIFHSQVYPGGLIGLGISKGLMGAFNYAGVQVVLWTSLMGLVVFFSEKTLQELTEAPRQIFAWLWEQSKALLPAQSKLEKKKQKKSEDETTTQNKKKTFELQPELPGLIESTKKPFGIPAGVTEFLNEDEDLDAALADFDEPEDHDTEEEKQRPAVMAQKRRVVLKAKPPTRVENWNMPKLELLEDPPSSRLRLDKDEIKRKAELLVEKLQKFKVDGEIVDAKPGPLVTMYEFKPSPDVKISEISNLEDDLCLALSSDSVRVLGQISGTGYVGIETANTKRETVFYKDLIAEQKFWNDDIALPIALGKQANGDNKIENLRAMPHLLIAGTTGSGKSVFVRSMIAGLLFRHSPKTLRLILIDPKMVDLAQFADVPHLILPHITEPKRAVRALKWACREMEKRYRSLSRFGASKIEIFNEKISKLSKEELSEHEKVNAELETTPGGSSQQYYFSELPFIAIFIDELADLMVSDKQEIEPSIQKLAQKARACGIHLVLATQTPRKDVVTGLIKANIPGRIALKVANKLDPRVIIDEGGAERLLPNGDMLFLAPGINKPTRHHGPFLSDNEIDGVVKFWADQSSEPNYDDVGLKMLEGGVDGSTGTGEGGLEGAFSEDDAGEEYDMILRWTAEQQSVSASLLQRRFSIGYPKAARFIEIMERNGVIAGPNGSKPRQVLVSNLK